MNFFFFGKGGRGMNFVLFNYELPLLQVNPGSKAALKGIREGDIISSINGTSTKNIRNCGAHSLLRNAGEQLRLSLNE